MTLQRILVPTDFSDTARHALDHARDLALSFDAAIDLLHVVPNLTLQWASEASGFVAPDLLETWRTEAEQRLAAIVVEGVRVERMLRIGHPFVEIVTCARERGVDLIVIGTHGHGAVAHMLLGSVAEKVVRKAPCPVLTVRQPGHTFVMPATDATSS